MSRNIRICWPENVLRLKDTSLFFQVVNSSPRGRRLFGKPAEEQNEQCPSNIRRYHSDAEDRDRRTADVNVPKNCHAFQEP